MHFRQMQNISKDGAQIDLAQTATQKSAKISWSHTRHTRGDCTRSKSEIEIAIKRLAQNPRETLLGSQGMSNATSGYQLPSAPQFYPSAIITCFSQQQGVVQKELGRICPNRVLFSPAYHATWSKASLRRFCDKLRRNDLIR